MKTYATLDEARAAAKTLGKQDDVYIAEIRHIRHGKCFCFVKKRDVEIAIRETSITCRNPLVSRITMIQSAYPLRRKLECRRCGRKLPRTAGIKPFCYDCLRIEVPQFFGGAKKQRPKTPAGV